MTIMIIRGTNQDLAQFEWELFGFLSVELFIEITNYVYFQTLG